MDFLRTSKSSSGAHAAAKNGTPPVTHGKIANVSVLIALVTKLWRKQSLSVYAERGPRAESTAESKCNKRVSKRP